MFVSSASKIRTLSTRKNYAFRVFIDAGHGGISPLLTKSHGHRYTTFPAKCWQHPVHNLKSGTWEGSFHNGGWFYEGVFNRQVASKIEAELDDLGIDYFSIYHDYIDTPLKTRYTTVNRMAQYCDNSLLLSLHANASKTQVARGYEIYTSPGKTIADWIAEQHYNHTNKLFGKEIRYRQDLTDGDHDREARFAMLVRTTIPSVLVEHLFFDNYLDAILLCQEDVIDRFAKASVLTICDYLDRLGIPYGPDKINQS